MKLILKINKLFQLPLEKSTRIKCCQLFRNLTLILQISSDEDQDLDEVVKPTTKKSKKTKKSHRVIESGL